MSVFKSVLSVYLTIGLMVFATFAQGTRNEREVRGVLQNLNTKIDDFRNGFDNELNGRSINRKDENDIRNYLDKLENSINEFQTQFQRRQETAEYVSEILDPARGINDIVMRQGFSSKLRKNWLDTRSLLDRLAANYSIGWSWNDRNSYPNDNRSSGNFPSTRANSYSNTLTGTYKLDASRSDNASEIAERAIGGGRRNNNARNTTDARSDLESKLEAPEQIMIDVRGNQVTLASSRAPQITFAADGRDRTETAGGKTIRVRATLRSQELTVSSLGGENDYTVTFAPADNGNSMRVTRRITTDYLRETVFAESIYQKTDSIARFENGGNTGGDYSSNDGTYSSNDPQDNRTNYPSNYPSNSPNNYPTTTTGARRSGDYVVTNGTILTGILESNISTKVSQNNDRFRMTVQAPNEYRGAVIEGYISGINRSGQVSGRSQITFNFERVRLANGQTYDFAGFLQSVTDEKGDSVRVDSEGAAKGGDQTKETVKRGGIGAGLGALIGAVIGGGKGAAIGAVLGGSAGAGSVVLQGRDDLELKAGSSITVQASSPIR